MFLVPVIGDAAWERIGYIQSLFAASETAHEIAPIELDDVQNRNLPDQAGKWWIALGRGGKAERFQQIQYFLECERGPCPSLFSSQQKVEGVSRSSETWRE